MPSKQDVLREMGFKPAASLEEALNSDFIIDISYGSVNDIAIYAVTKKAEIKADVLCLRDTVIRHTASTDNLSQIFVDDFIFQTIKNEKSWQRCPYSFSKEDIEKTQKLWVLDPEVKRGTPAWRVHLRERVAFLRRYEKDMAEYSIF